MRNPINFNNLNQDELIEIISLITSLKDSSFTLSNKVKNSKNLPVVILLLI